MNFFCPYFSLNRSSLPQHRSSRSDCGNCFSVVLPRCSTNALGTIIGYTFNRLHCSIAASSAYHPSNSSSSPPIACHKSRAIMKHHPDKLRPFCSPNSFRFTSTCLASFGHLGDTTGQSAVSSWCSHPDRNRRSLLANITHGALPCLPPRFIKAL